MRVPVPCLCVAAALGLAACGGDDGLSRADYITQADAICAQANARIRTLSPPTSTADLVAVSAASLRISQPALVRLRALRPAAEAKAAAAAITTGLAGQTALLGQLRSAAMENDLRKVADIGTRGQRSADALETRARALGFRECGIQRG